MKTIDIAVGDYAARWGLADLYPESRKMLAEALSDSLEFSTEWFGCKKEINYAKVERRNGAVYVSVCCCMDDLFDSDDLIYDAMYTEFRSTEQLPDDVIEGIRDWAVWSGVDDHTEAVRQVSVDASIDEVISCIGDLESLAEKNNQEMFAELCEYVRARV